MTTMTVATAPPEARGIARDGVRLLVSDGTGHRHAVFSDLAAFLEPGDLIVINDSATLPASVAADGFVLNLSTRLEPDLWVAEPRWTASEPGPLPLAPGDWRAVAGVPARFVAPYPGLPRLWFVRIDGTAAMKAAGRPIRYGYVEQEWPLEYYQTIFATTPGSAEMPSAARPFTSALVERLRHCGVGFAAITLHTGVSSIEGAIFPEPYWVPAATADAVNRTREAGHRVIAAGTTVVRALETAWNPAIGRAQASTGFSRLYVTPEKGVHAVDGLITGLHEEGTTHLDLLAAVGGSRLVDDAYRELRAEGYLWHEFGDSHLIIPGNHRAGRGRPRPAAA